MTNTSMSTCWNLFASQTALCTWPVALLVMLASLDAADKQMLASSFPMLERTLGLSVQALGYFSMCTNLSYALSLPVWGALVHWCHSTKQNNKYYGQVHRLLAVACVSWGLATMGIAWMGDSLIGQAIFRALVGFALGSIMPLSQTLLMEVVDVSMRGRAFGLVSVCEKLAGTLAAAAVVSLEVWQLPYYVLGLVSILMGYMTWSVVLGPSKKNTTTTSSSTSTTPLDDKGPPLTLRQIVQRLIQMPAFLCLVAQGIFGGTPWDMMSFLLLLMEWRGFTKRQIVTLQCTSGITSMMGAWLGGYLGDYAAQRWGQRGRIGLAWISVVGGMIWYGLYLYATQYGWALLWLNVFYLWGTWTQAGALRPLCAAWTRNPSERAQIISLWIVLEKLSGAVLGAPLVGYLTSRGSDLAENGSDALAYYLWILSSFFWTICAFFWFLMARVMDPDILDRDNVERKALL